MNTSGLPSASASSAAALDEAVPTEAQLTSVVTGTLAPGQTQIIPAPIVSATTALLEVVSFQPLSVTLANPAGATVVLAGPEVNAQQFYTVVEPAADDVAPVWRYLFQLDHPTDGVWQLAVQATQETQFQLVASVESPLRLWLGADKSSYQPGETVTLSTVMAEGQAALPGYTFSATATRPDGSTFPLALYDDGTHGDKYPGDAFCSMQFTAPAASEPIDILVQATNGNLVRFTEDTVFVVAQTATIDGVGNEQVVDADGNGLADALTVDVAFTVLEAGHYDVAANLVTTDGVKLADGVYTSLRGEPLSAGQHVATLRFEGKTLREQGVGGRYVLDRLAGDFAAGVGFGGDKNDIFVCAPTALGETTSCSLGLFWDAGSHGLSSGNVRGIELVPPVGGAAIADGQVTVQQSTRLYLPFIGLELGK